MNLDKKTFEQEKKNGKNFVVWKKVISDTITPVSALINVSEIHDFYCLFESVTGGETRGRYSILAFDPDILWKCDNKQAYIKSHNSHDFVKDDKAVFESLKSIIDKSKIDIPEDIPNMAAGLFGYMGYDMVKIMENIPDKNPKNIDIPDGLYFRPKVVIVFDNISDVSYIVYSYYINSEDKSYEDVSDYIKNLEEEVLVSKIKPKKDTNNAKNFEVNFKSNTTQEEFHKMVERSISYIKSGDIFQIVPSRRFVSNYSLSPISFYRSLRSINPSPYLFFLNVENFSIIGSSPEILVKLEDGEVTVRPLAGTKMRGENLKEDLQLEKELLADEKEKAEHLMLLDLGRNDVSRVTEPGSLKITEKMNVERYSHVMHLVSNVSGKIKEGLTSMDALIAGFPAGTVSGAPKIRAMEIIEELEKEKRQFYAGTVGYFSATGEMNTCIALRTALIKDNKIFLQAGAGVVYDSIPENEYIETENKAMALIKAAKMSINYI
jgi:anthranilate synthase component 1